MFEWKYKYYPKIIEKFLIKRDRRLYTSILCVKQTHHFRYRLYTKRRRTHVYAPLQGSLKSRKNEARSRAITQDESKRRQERRA